MKSWLLILLSIGVLTLSSALLFQHNIDELNPEKGKDWWSVAFIRPDRIRNIDIVVTNYTEDTHFSYEIIADGKTRASGDFEAPLGENKILLITPEKAFSEKHVVVRVHHKEETEELFRNYK